MKTILVVDDNPDVILSLKTGLEENRVNCCVVGVQSGKGCFEFLENNSLPDIILLDIMMPEMSGWGVYDKLKQQDVWKNIPVLFVTARNDRIAKNAGAFLAEDYIEKPFEIADVATRINNVLKKNSNMRKKI